MKRTAKLGLMRAVAGCCCVLLASVGFVYAQVAKVGDCVVDREVWTLPECALITRGTKLYVSKPFLPLFFPNDSSVRGPSSHESRHLAWADLPDGGWAYFDRTGLVIVQHVASMDNGPSEFHHGLVRIKKGDKWGLSNPHGKLVVPLKYDGMLDFDEGAGWLACSGCHTEAEPGGEYHFFAGGNWVRLDRHGKVLGNTGNPRQALDQKAQN